MKLGVVLRNMGPQSTREILTECAVAAERAGLADVWVTDHIAIPPDDAEGSGGRYLDPLATLAYLAGRTERIGLGTAVLVLPYRPALPTAKWVATVQELSGHRLRLGVAPGWMEPEFRAAGVERRRRGALTDETLAFLHRCFRDDVVESHGQPLLFRPRPPRPPIYIGGSGTHALRRAVRFGDGWLPMGADPAKLAAPMRQLAALAAEAGVATPTVVAMARLPLADAPRACDQLDALTELGVTQVIHADRYLDAEAFRSIAARLADLIPR